MAVTQAQVAQLYVALFNRAPEGAGFNAWVNAGANSTIAKMANDMLSSPAALAYFNGSIDHDRDFVEMLYKNILGKDYSQDPDGINAWVKHIQLGNSRGDTVAKLFEVATSAIAKAADPVAAKVFENKTAVSQYMAEKIADIPADQTGAYDYSLFQEIIATTNNTNLDEQKARIDALIAPTIHNLSADANDVSGTGKSDVFNGAVSATVGQTTFKATDKLDGKGGNDTLNLDLYTNFYGMTNGTGEVKNIENLNLTNKTNGDLRFDTKYIHNLETITLNGENKVDVINPENKVKLLVNDLKLSGNGDTGRLNLIYNTDVLAGSNDDQEIVVNNVNMDKDARINITTVNGDHIEALTINAVGGASKLTNFTSNTIRQPDQTASIKTMHIKGTADLTVDTTSGLYSFDATEYKGNKLIANVKANGYVQSIKGSGQDDVFNVTGASGRIIPIDGGAGKDTVNFIDAINGNQHVEMTGVEELNIKATAAVLDFSRAQEIDTLGVSGTNPTVSVLNSKIKTVNVNAMGTAKITTNGSPDMERVNITGGSRVEVVNNGSRKLNTIINTQTATTDLNIKSNSLKEATITLEKVGHTGVVRQTLDDISSLETLKVVNKSSNFIDTYINNVVTSGSNSTNALNLKTIDVEASGSFYVSNKLSGISKINLKANGKETDFVLNVQIGEKTYAPNPYQGTQDIIINAENFKNLNIARGAKIYTSRDINLTSVTDKTDAIVAYGQIGESDNYKANDVIVNATGQKTLMMNNIYAVGNINLTTKFTQEGSVANYTAGNMYTTGDITIYHTSNSDITDGVINFLSHAQARNFTVNASGYKELNINNSTNQRITATGDMTFNLKASVAGSIADIGHTLPFDNNNAPIKAKSLTINAAADDGITDAVLKLGDYWGDVGEGGNINITAVNQKTVSLGWLRGLNSGYDNKKSDVNINLSTNIQDSDVTIGYNIPSYPYTKGIGHNGSQMVKNVNLKAHGQKTFKAEAIMAAKETKININGSGLDSTAEFNRIISREGITIKADNLKELKTGSILASQGNINISTGSFDAMQYAEFNSGSNSVHMAGVNINLDISNVIEPVNSRVSQPGQHWDKALYLSAGKALNIKAYVGDDVTKIYARLGAAEKNATADIVNVKGTIMGGWSISPNNKTETMTIKGGITNPASILAIDGGVNHNSNLTVDLSYMPKLKSIDLSGYNNASGTNKIIIRSTELEISSIKGSSTQDDISIVYAANTKLKTVDTGAGDDEVTFGGNTTQTHDVTVNLGEGNDTITTAALTANKKFQISGGAGNDTFNLGASTTDASASKYITITDTNRGDKISLGSAGAATLQKITLNVDGRADLKTAINDALGSLSSTAANTIYAVYYGNDTYLVRDANSNKALDANDNLVKLAGISNFDLLNANSVTEGGVNYIEITNA